ATFTLFFAVAAWNDYFWPMLMLQSDSLRTLPLMLRTLVISDTLDTSSFNASISENLRSFSEGIKMAGVLLTMLPVMCVYPFLQKHFAKGMLVGSIKS
ncbi:MAG: carbohydrate ABC transporter permease, partial [Aristaeellaceae bacterium]